MKRAAVLGRIEGWKSARRALGGVVLIIAGYLLVSCAPSDVSEKRAAYARQKSGPLQLALVWPFVAYDDLIDEGVRLAVDEVNERGGVLGRPLELLLEDDNAEVEKSLLVAETLTENPRVMAVIGHCNSVVSLSVALTYEINDLIMFSPASTNKELFGKGYKYIFHNMPSDEVMGSRAADLCAEKDLHSIAIVYSNDSHGLSLANAFEKRMHELDIKVADRRSCSEGTGHEIDYILDCLEVYSIDGFFFAGPIDVGLTFLAHARARGYRQPVIGCDGLDSLRLLELPSDVGEDVFVLTAYNPYSGRKAALDFNAAFLRRYGHSPDSWAALGYDAVKVLVEAMGEARSADPRKAAPALHALKDYPGVTGVHTFDEKGDVKDKTVFVKFPENGEFRNLDFQGGVE